jgi:hypothetical protein
MIKLLKIKRASQYYSYGGDVIDEMPKKYIKLKTV